MSEFILTIDGIDPLHLFGFNDVKLNLLKNAYSDIKITSRGNYIKLKGNKERIQEVKSKFEKMITWVKSNKDLTIQTVIDLIEEGDLDVSNNLLVNDKAIVYTVSGKAIKSRTRNQKSLVDLCHKNDIVFAIGPAGTGKTFIAVALAVRSLKNKLVNKIVLTRPAVEAGESLGFLPGNLNDKVDPYLRPLYDALRAMIKTEKLNFFLENNTIEVAPLAFMRGRTLDNAFIILDEAQNCTPTQIKMFLTRLGPNAKCIITGDVTQIDLPKNQTSGLIKAMKILPSINGIGIVNLGPEDVVRHSLVKKIILKYDEDAQNKISNKN